MSAMLYFTFGAASGLLLSVFIHVSVRKAVRAQMDRRDPRAGAKP